MLEKGQVQFLNNPLVFKPQNRHPSLSNSAAIERTGNNPTATSSRMKDINEVVNLSFLFNQDNQEVVDMKPASYLVKEDAGKVLFLKKLVLTRRLFRNKQNFPAALARLMGELREAHVDVDLQDVSKRRSYWQDIHNAVKRGKQTSVYAEPLKVIFDDAPIESLWGTDFEPEPQAEAAGLGVVDPRHVAATAAMFCKGELWHNLQ